MTHSYFISPAYHYQVLFSVHSRKRLLQEGKEIELEPVKRETLLLRKPGDKKETWKHVWLSALFVKFAGIFFVKLRSEIDVLSLFYLETFGVYCFENAVIF